MPNNPDPSHCQITCFFCRFKHLVLVRHRRFMGTQMMFIKPSFSGHIKNVFLCVANRQAQTISAPTHIHIQWISECILRSMSQLERRLSLSNHTLVSDVFFWYCSRSSTKVWPRAQSYNIHTLYTLVFRACNIHLLLWRSLNIYGKSCMLGSTWYKPWYENKYIIFASVNR